MILIAKRPYWELYDRQRSFGQWHNFKLVALRAGRCKRNWWLGWNGQRFDSGSDAKFLAEHEPEIHAWVHSRCAAMISLPLEEPRHVTEKASH